MPITFICRNCNFVLARIVPNKNKFIIFLYNDYTARDDLISALCYVKEKLSTCPICHRELDFSKKEIMVK